MGLAKIAGRGLAAALLAMPVLSMAEAPDLGDDKASAFKGTQKVAIAEFDVEFYTQLVAEVHKNSGASARYFATLQGVADADFQAVTDKAYQDTVDALKAAGFEVVDLPTLTANPGYQALAEKYGAPSPYTFTDSSIVKSEPNISLIYAPAGMKAWSLLSRSRHGRTASCPEQDPLASSRHAPVALGGAAW